jgi:NAD(P)-dependent dehydrogenase (short-subunit alcohol dehydrogenase family)
MNRAATRTLIGAAGAGLALGFALRRARLADLSGQAVLITGGSRGLGLALAREFARVNCKIAICARDKSELESAREILNREEGAEVFAAPCDVTRKEQVDELVEAVRSWSGGIDILVNNAGMIRVAPVENLTIQDFEEAMAVMFWGVVYPTMAVLKEMRKRGSGRIATVASIGGKVSVPHLLPYCCAKFAAVGFCEGLRAEVSRHGVKVITIAPGLMRTGSYRKAEFKGSQRAEAAWFSLGATLPMVSMSAERAARQIVTAIRRGQAEKILSTQATLLARVNGAFPGLVPDLLGLVARLLPSDDAGRQSILTGARAEEESGEIFKALTTLGRRAAHRLNEMHTGGAAAT